MRNVVLLSACVLAATLLSGSDKTGTDSEVAEVPFPVLSDEPQQFAKHAVAAEERQAAEVGRAILNRGGNAIDAAIASAFALAVTHPAAGNIGGGGFMVVFLADRGQVDTFEFREAAPLASTERMYVDSEGRLRPHHRDGARAAGVPGTVRGLELAHKTYGSLPWKALVTPAVGLARDGFEISGTLARSLNTELRIGSPPTTDADDEPDPGKGRLADFASSRQAFAKPNGTPWAEGDRLIQPDLAATLERIADRGAAGFYEGRTADLIADYNTRNGGLITRDDLRLYQARRRPPIHARYRGHDVYSVGPPSSGGVVLGLILNVLERYDLAAEGPNSPRTVHRVTEAMRRAFYVRATELADPDFVAVPTERLLSQPFADRLASSIDDARATPSAALAPFQVEPVEGQDTTHLSVLDSKGNAVALTYTLEEAYGSKAVVEGAGFLLNNEMGDFNLVPGRTDARGLIGTEPNRIAPRKRMLSSQTPTIVAREGRVRLVTGSPGGRTIPNTVACVVLQVVAFGRPPVESVQAARFHHAWFPDVLKLEGQTWDTAAVAALEKMGHRVDTARVQGVANSVIIDEKTRQIWGVADIRSRTSHAAGD